MKKFLDAQANDYEQALNEIRAGHKHSHWIWYIFPQLKDLGRSSIAVHYGIRDLAEAKEYLTEPTLRARLIEISAALLQLPGNDPLVVMGHPDEQKLWSCMTLFASISEEGSVFHQVLEKFFVGQTDPKTVNMLK